MNFVGVAERLAGRCALFALDLRGRGDSDKPDAPYGFTQHARDVAAAMRAMGLGPSIVVGHSMGAFVATALAAQDPDLVSGLVLLDGGLVPNTPTGDSSGQGVAAALALRITQLRQTYGSRQAYREFWRTQPHFPAEEWNPWVEAFLDYEVGGDSPVQPKASETAVLADLREVFQPNAISGFTPGQQPLFPDALAAQFQTLLPQIQDHKFAGTTHYTIVLGEKAATKIADLIVDLHSKLTAEPSPAI
jgi:pimeloyl-ACP methyl ester carboxylesterase